MLSLGTLLLLSTLLLIPINAGVPFWFYSGSPSEIIQEEYERLASVQDYTEPMLPKSKEILTPNLNLLQAFKKVDFWVILIIVFCVPGSGITILNNLSEIVISWSDIPNGTSISEGELPNTTLLKTCVVLFSVCNTLGRMITGYFSDLLAKRLVKSAWLFLSSCIMFVVQIYFILAPLSAIMPGVTLLGLSYGIINAILPVLILELFGLRHFGANLGVLGVSSGLALEILSTLVAGQNT